MRAENPTLGRLMDLFNPVFHKKYRALLLTVGAVLLPACGLAFRGSAPMVPGNGWGGGRSYATNGEQIYFTAANARGQRIPYSGGPSFGGMMMGQQLSCASCHGNDGRGGLHVMHMERMDAPDIRFVTLSGEGGEHGDGEPGEGHGGEYSLETFREAVVNGRHPNGEALDRDMPRWQLEDEDLADLFEFLKTLP